MGELSSIAFNSSFHSSSLGFDFHNLEVFNADMFQFNEMESSSINGASTPPSVEAAGFSSTGYLEDVLFEFTCKRRRLFLFSDQQNQDLVDHSTLKCWTSNFMQDCRGNFDSISQITKCDTISDMRTTEEEVSETYDSSLYSSLKEPLVDSQCTPHKGNLYICRDPIVPSGANDHKKRSKRALAKVVMYPFALVKPGGFEGNLTLNDINKRILMPPTRAVHHPVGEFAARPLAAPEGQGLSGKAVVAFTKIQTRGRGTITIIRTRN